jgi:hypothetical protein
MLNLSQLPDMPEPAGKPIGEMTGDEVMEETLDHLRYLRAVTQAIVSRAAAVSPLSAVLAAVVAPPRKR